ncbi:hypothetical protein, partial [Streptomyces sp. CBMA156]|uniref:hypothetical protein n=1 Tax=Streptomyces sp. CBMA156 TaxID=1930280 RepID=UPI00166207CA
AVTAFGGPAGDAPAAKPAAATAPAASPTATTTAPKPTATPKPTVTSSVPAATPTTPSAAPTSALPVPRNQPAALQVQSFRQAVAQAEVGRERDKQTDLLRILDATAARLNEGSPDDAAQELKSAQKVVRDMGKKHAVDVLTYANWNARLSALFATLHTAADLQDD